MPSILTKPAQTLSGIPGTYQTGITVAGSTTDVVDSVVGANNHSLKWIVTLVDNTNTKVRMCEVSAVNKLNSSVSHCVDNINGDFIGHGVDVQLNAGNIELIIANNEIEDIDVSIIRLQTIHS